MRYDPLPEITFDGGSRLSPGLRDELGLDVDDEELVRRTVRFLLGHQGAADFPDIVEVEDVVAGYPDYLDAVRG